MSNAYQKSIELGLQGDDAAKVAVLRAITRGPIPVANVLQYFDEQNLAELDPIDNAWVGTLVDVIRDQNTPAPIVAGLRKLFVHLAKRTSQSVDTTIPEVAVETLALLTALIQMNVVTTAQRDAFYALDGGRPFADLTVEQFTTQRTAAEEAATLAAQRNALRMRLDAIWNQVGTAEQLDAIADLRAIATELEGA